MVGLTIKYPFFLASSFLHENEINLIKWTANAIVHNIKHDSLSSGWFAMSWVGWMVLALVQGSLTEVNITKTIK